MVIVDFEYVSENKVFKEMVQDLQNLLLTGGIQTNSFRPKRKRLPDGSVSEYENQIVLYVNSLSQAKEAALFLDTLPEVARTQVKGPEANNEL